MPQNSTLHVKRSWVEAWNKFWKDVRFISGSGAEYQTDAQTLFNITADSLQHSRLQTKQIEEINQLAQLAYLIGRENLANEISSKLRLTGDEIKGTLYASKTD